MISVTGIVYWLLLAGEPTTGLDWVANMLVHTVVPVAAVGSWLLVGPHGRFRWGLLPLMLLIPVAWLVFAMMRGAISGYYPYFFIDVTEVGYAMASLSILGVVAFALIVACAYVGLDKVMCAARRRVSSIGMRYRFITCDVFTDRRFGGNPLAVLPEAAGLPPELMQQVAREFNYSETAFVLPAEQGHDRRVRIFTPGREVPFAGHPNVGTAFVLASSGEFGPVDALEVTFEEARRSGARVGAAT